MTLQKAVREKAFDVFDTEIFYYLRQCNKALTTPDIYWHLTDALYEKIDNSPWYTVCDEVSEIVQQYAEN
jgi:hypothetical protein